LIGKLEDDKILVDVLKDIWMRDFTLVNPENPVRMKY